MRNIRVTPLIVLVLALLVVLPLFARAADPLPAVVPAPSALPVPAPAIVPAQEPKKVEPAQAAPTVRIGYADISRIGSESAPGKAAQLRFKAKADKYQTQITAKQKQLEKQKAAIEAKLPSLLPEQRAAKAKEFEKKVDDYRRFVQNAEKELKPLEEELTRSLFGEIEKVVTDYAKANGFAAIVAKKELLYQGGSVTVQDVTDDILKLVNEKGQKK
ncbi:OmpH family outer membrane protein [Geobacter argillaceus]|uniref:Periplasmic chaperone for outer membrane proteins Skp n=1 Tax=Geobacter argillaceus TaxID=345631 RepID=A0A562WT08_9BACT|nr:OmpH family outer membrane protein [Geobacter argillaceus]TWJ33573.1 periplasmic chaperone for outer membrane proteins Skp [Geobacter argillaceus]